MDKWHNIFLIGFSGSGKSTVGSLLARTVRATFLDSDSLIEECFGKSISRIFSEEGENTFREAESDVISEVMTVANTRRVIALGGGAFQTRGNRQMIMDHDSLVIYLSCSVRELYRRLTNNTDRPLLQARLRPGESKRQALQRQIATLLNRRRKQYSLADITVSTTNRSPVEVSRFILNKIKELDAKSSR
ncbi:MAG: shikimate kinase [candidate division Zixibacteria bacterium]|nr:shikimate kinase [candidate division Zixibacteria bacterium]